MRLLRWSLIAAVAVGLALIVFLADIADVIELPEGIVLSAGTALNRFGYLGGFLLIYIEESGIPLLIPGDIWLIYVGHRLLYQGTLLIHPMHLDDRAADALARRLREELAREG